MHLLVQFWNAISYKLIRYIGEMKHHESSEFSFMVFVYHLLYTAKLVDYLHTIDWQVRHEIAVVHL